MRSKRWSGRPNSTPAMRRYVSRRPRSWIVWVATTRRLSSSKQSFKLTPHREDLVRGLQLQRMGNIREAEKRYRDVLTKDPENVDALRLLAGVAMRAKQWSDAQVLLERALEIAPDLLPVLDGYRAGPSGAGRTDEAIEAFERRFAWSRTTKSYTLPERQIRMIGRA